MDKIEFEFDGHKNVNDNYGVKERFANLIEEMIDIYNTDMTKFYSPKKNRSAGTRSRVRIRGARAAMHDIWGDIQKQKQDFDSEYE